mmetsp:Transcript_30453/g.81096  ORF Transcript_30453/g.81096 Transcript_30453/m.81096 type:complete len:121 (+) Transcript_30453:1760-2122(+)
MSRTVGSSDPSRLASPSGVATSIDPSRIVVSPFESQEVQGSCTPSFRIVSPGQVFDPADEIRKLELLQKIRGYDRKLAKLRPVVERLRASRAAEQSELSERVGALERALLRHEHEVPPPI